MPRKESLIATYVYVYMQRHMDVHKDLYTYVEISTHGFVPQHCGAPKKMTSDKTDYDVHMITAPGCLAVRK